MDWDTFYFEYWLVERSEEGEPTHVDYQEWLYDKADLALGKD